MIIVLIKYGAVVDYPTRIGRTALMLACRHKHVYLAEHLLKYGARVNCTDYFGCSPLYIAAVEMRDYKMAKVLLKRQADPNLKMGKGLTIFLELILNYRPEDSFNMVRLFLKYGRVDPEERDPKSGKTCYHYVVLTNNVPLAKVLIDYADNANIEDFTGKTPLELAKAMGFKEMEKLFREQCHTKERFRTPAQSVSLFGVTEARQLEGD